MIVYRAARDVPTELAWFVAKLLLAERRRRGTPGSMHDLTCAREHALGALCAAAAAGLPTLADPGCNGAGIGIHVRSSSPPAQTSAEPRDQLSPATSQRGLMRLHRRHGRRVRGTRSRRSGRGT